MEINKVFSILVVSSFIFITNVVSAFCKKYYTYCFLFFCLTITSIIFHYNNNIYTSILDKFFILAIVFYGGYMIYNKTTSDNQIYFLIVLIGFISCIFLFCYGYYVEDYCFNPDKYVGEKYHTILHIISSVIHHLIIFI